MSKTTQLRTAIYDKLVTLSGAGQPLAEVKPIPSEQISAFPCAIIRPSGGQSSFFTNTDNFRTYSFDIAILQEIENVGHLEAYDILSDALDIIVPALDQDFQLGGASDFNDPVNWVWDVDTIGNGAVLFVVISLNCKAEENVLP